MIRVDQETFIGRRRVQTYGRADTIRAHSTERCQRVGDAHVLPGPQLAAGGAYADWPADFLERLLLA